MINWLRNAPSYRRFIKNKNKFNLHQVFFPILIEIELFLNMNCPTRNFYFDDFVTKRSSKLCQQWKSCVSQRTLVMMAITWDAALLNKTF